RFVDHQDIALRRDPFRDDDLLLIASGEATHDRLQPRRFDSKAVEVLAGRLSLLTPPDEAQPGEAAEDRQGFVLPDLHATDEAVALTVFGVKPDPVLDRDLGVLGREWLAMDGHVAGRARIEAEDRFDDLRAPCANKTGEAQDLAIADFEGNISELAR